MDVDGLEGDFVVTTIDDREVGVRLWGDQHGAPIFWLHPRPGSRMLRDPSDAYVRHSLAVCSYDRPGYGLSTRRPGRTLANTVDDVSAVADFLEWDHFAVAGYSGGSGPALAVAALMPDRVTRCAVVAGEAPPFADEIQAAMPDDELAYLRRHGPCRRDAADQGVRGVRRLGQCRYARYRHHRPRYPFHVRRRRSRSRATGAAGYIDDNIATARDWGFSVTEVDVPTKVMGATGDTEFMHVSAHWLADHIPGAELLWRQGGHVGAGGDEEQRLFAWLGHGVFPKAPTTD